LANVSLELTAPDNAGPLQFALSADRETSVFELELYEDDDTPAYRYRQTAGPTVQIVRGRGSDPNDAVDFFYEDPPIMWFVDGSSLEGNQYTVLAIAGPPFDDARIEVWDWSGVN